MGQEFDGEITTSISFELSSRLLELLRQNQDSTPQSPWIQEMIEEEDMTFYPSEGKHLLKEVQHLALAHPKNDEFRALAKFIERCLAAEATIYVWPD